jgi:hypothetical protein
MPVTAKLSLAFHEKLGETVANELVDWFIRAEGEEGDSIGIDICISPMPWTLPTGQTCGS